MVTPAGHPARPWLTVIEDDHSRAIAGYAVNLGAPSALQRHWSRLNLTLSADDFTDAEAIAAVARIIGGNFRLVQRLFAQVQRIMEINNLSTITREVVGPAARPGPRAASAGRRGCWRSP